MGLFRNALLAASSSAWLREQATRRRFVRRAVARFMPGERIEDALAAAEQLRAQGLATMLTHLGENLTRLEEAEAVTRHYLDVLDRVSAAGLDAQISVKLTQLGLDLSADVCRRNLERLLERVEARGNVLWIDMEQSRYVEPTLALYRHLRAQSARIGVALQAYLYRTAQDLEALLPLGAAVRLVKGAYLEPPAVAYRRRRDVDENYYRLACRALDANAGHPEAILHIATHDLVLVERLRRFIRARTAPVGAYEFAMLYGIRPADQRRLAREGERVRVLISYGDYWFPWFMRRLAERPANVLFVLRQLAA